MTTFAVAELPTAKPEIPRDGHGNPLVIPPEGGKPVALTRCTTYIDCLEDKSSIARWGKRMVLVGSTLNGGVREAAMKVLTEHETPREALADKEAKRRLDALAERAAELAGANDKREKGTELHALSELVDAGAPLPATLPKADLLDMAAYALVVAPFKMLRVEESVVIPDLGVQGTFDRMVYFEGYLPTGEWYQGNVIFDLKTGSSMEYGGLKMAAQLGAYSRGQRYDYLRFPTPQRRRLDYKDGEKNTPEFEEFKRTQFDAETAAGAYEPIPPVSQEWGIICHLSSGTSEAELYWADLSVGWEACLMAGSIRRMRALSSKALTPFSRDTLNRPEAA